MFSLAKVLPPQSSLLFRFNILVAMGVVLIGFFQIFQVNREIARGYELREIESELQELQSVHQELTQETQQAQSLQNVARAVKMLGLVEADQPTYVQSGE